MTSPLCMLILLILGLLVITCGKAHAQCMTGVECFGTTIPGLNSFDDCCRPVLNDFSIIRSFEDMSDGYTCSPCYVIGLEEARYELSENNTVYPIRLRVLAPSGQSGRLIDRPRLRLLGIPETASEYDFSIVTSDILLTTYAGIDVSVTLSVDGLAGEPNETFAISYQAALVASPNDARFYFRNTTFLIIDADKPTYEFDQGDYVTTEGPGASIAVAVRQTLQSAGNGINLLLTPLTYAQYIALSTYPGSTLAPIDTFHGSRPRAATYDPSPDGRRDFNNTVQAISFPPNSGVGTVRIVHFPVYDDVIDEEPEGFIIVLDVDSSTAVEVAFNPELRTALGRINDDDPFFFGFEQEEYVYNELLDEGVQEIPFSAAPGNMTEKSLRFTLNLNAIERAFIFGSNGDLSFGPNNLSPNINFDDMIITPSIINDDIIEGREVGSISIAASTTYDFALPRFRTVRVVINDDDGASMTLSAPPVVQESIGFFMAIISILTPTTAITLPLEIDISETPITAAMIADFRRNGPPSVILQGDVRPACCERKVPYLVRDDNVAEPDEIFSINMANSIVNRGVPVTIVVPSVNVTIIDNDVARIGFVNTLVNVSEGDGTASLTAAVLGNVVPGREVIVRFSTADGTATAGSDYSGTFMNITFSSSVQRIVVRVPILQDILCEGTEQFRASLSLMESNGINVDVSPSQTIVDIIDDDELWIGFTQLDYSGLEGDFVQPVVKVLSGRIASGVTVAVRFETAYIQAIATFDFKQTDQILEFSSINTSITVPVPLLSDSIYEHTEVFFCSLRRQPTPLNVHVFPDRSALYIIDNSNVTIGFRVADIHVTEHVGNAMLIVEVKKGKLSRTISLQYSTLDGTARAGMDHTTTTGTITFTPTTTQQTISIPIINDMVRESRETLTVRLTNAPTRVSLAPDKAWISIIDNDTVVIGFVPKRSVSSEESGRGQFTIRVISGRLDSTTSVVVLLNTASCTADSEIDFRPLQDVRLVFNSTQHSITVPFDIINDVLVEHDEALMASIKLAVPVARVSLVPDEAELTIIDTVDRGFRG